MKQKKGLQGSNDEGRRSLILEAALDCFLKFGFGKTSLDDIAKAANISRPLIYLKFKNKDEIFKGAFEYLVADGFSEVEKVLKSDLSKREKLLSIYSELILKPWDKVMDKPMASEFYETCAQLFPEVSDRHEKAILKFVNSVLQNKEDSEAFTLAVVGFQSDIPSTKILTKRIELLAERFL